MKNDNDEYDSLRELVAGVAHEMNTPLGVCFTLQSSLSDNLSKFQDSYNNEELCEEDIDEHLESTKTLYRLLLKNIGTAINLTSQLKKMSFINSDWYECQPHQEICDIVDTQRLTDSKKINYTVEGGLSEYPVYVPSETISHIMVNLINNSILYGFEKMVEGCISIKMTDHQEFILIDYADNGIGIDPSIRSRVFDPFFTTGRNRGGTGLGLSIIYNLISKRLNGSIELQDTATGCNFLIKIPTTFGKSCEEEAQNE